MTVTANPFPWRFLPWLKALSQIILCNAMRFGAVHKECFDAGIYLIDLGRTAPYSLAPVYTGQLKAVTETGRKSRPNFAACGVAPPLFQ